ncbi:O-GlcNAc transferase, C-terminal,Tetratricopeptide repeat,Tetratricopeptide repeat [Cinara cedri]|uniref:protein O-GlcNAc transferase n=1 Tax=Cinara cedri TaxID=506608 RepID=A0A5E4MBS2_9HEMI|nr:O-GlcNAc transferase, C-terminal,Tetratricopeptide repeat,Tetratricopeptide repeat [Cinara cedri]
METSSLMAFMYELVLLRSEIFESAISFFEKKNYASTQEMCAILNVLQPNNLKVLLLLSLSYFMQGKYKKAIEILDKIPDKHLKYIKKLNYFVLNYLEKYQYPEASNDLVVCKKLDIIDKTSFYLKIAIQIFPRINFDISPILGDTYFHNGNILSAVKTYSLYLKDQSDNPVLLHDMGLIYLNHFNNAAAAQPLFKLCVDLDKRNTLYYESLISVYQQLDKKDLAFKTALSCAEVYMLNNDYIGAMNALLCASNLFPENYYPYWKMGLIFCKLDDDHNALMRFEDAKRMKPNFSLIYFNIANVYEKMNRLEEAEELYYKTLYFNPKHCDTYHKLIALKQRSGHIDDVITLYDLMLNHSVSDKFVIHKELANYFYNEVGNLKEAFNHFVKALEICDTDLNTYLALGTLSFKLNYRNAALNYFLKVLELFPDCLAPHLYIGYIYKERKQFNEAINEFKKVLNLHPNHPDAYCFLMECRRHICKFTIFDETNLQKLKDIVFHQLTNNEVPTISLQHSLLCNFESEVLIEIASILAKQYADKPYVQRSLYPGYVHDISVSNSCIRIGYIYTDSSSHPTKELVRSIRKLHDRNKFEVFCYSLSPINRLR